MLGAAELPVAILAWLAVGIVVVGIFAKMFEILVSLREEVEEVISEQKSEKRRSDFINKVLGGSDGV